MVDEVAGANAGAAIGSVGVVVGATPAAAPDSSALHGPSLMPGLGAQGGGAESVRATVPEATLRAEEAKVSRADLREGPAVSALRAKLDALQTEFAFLRP